MDKANTFDRMMRLTPIRICPDDHHVRIRLPDPPNDFCNVPRDPRGLEDDSIYLISYSRRIKHCHLIADAETRVRVEQDPQTLAEES